MLVSVRLRSIIWFVTGACLVVVFGMLFQAWRADAVGSDESTFVPITPCRLLDTRPNPDFNVGPRDTPLGKDDTHTVKVTGPQERCDIPAAATAVAINLTGVSPTAPTFVTIYPADVDLPEVSALNMIAGQPPTPNKLDVKLSPAGEIKIYNLDGTVHIIGDVLGYYRHDGLAGLESRGPIVAEQGIGWASNGNSTSNVETYENGTNIDGGGGLGGTAHLSLTGPISIEDTDYELESVTYCVQPSTGGFVDQASIIGLAGASGISLEVKDKTERSTDGCYTLVATPEVAARRTHHLMIVVVNTVRITEVTATWQPA